MSPGGWEGGPGWDSRLWVAAWKASSHLTSPPVSQGAEDATMKGEHEHLQPEWTVLLRSHSLPQPCRQQITPPPARDLRPHFTSFKGVPAALASAQMGPERTLLAISQGLH